jgi:hypothetical protein
MAVMKRPLLLLLLLLLWIAACGNGDGSDTSVTVTPKTTVTTTPPSSAEDFAVYLLHDTTSGEPGPFLTPVARIEPIGDEGSIAKAVDMLLKGYTFTESGMGLSSAVPFEVTLLGMTTEPDKVVTIDLSGDFAAGGGTASMTARLAQLVYTATQWDHDLGVRLALDGEVVDVFSSEGIVIDAPMTRGDFVDLRPAILVESPVWGATVGESFVVGGIARVFEATIDYAVVDNEGLILLEGVATASTGGPEWGEFAFPVDVSGIDLAETADPYDLTLIVWETSAEDGRQIHVMECPLILEQ